MRVALIYQTMHLLTRGRVELRPVTELGLVRIGKQPLDGTEKTIPRSDIKLIEIHDRKALHLTENVPQPLAGPS